MQRLTWTRRCVAAQQQTRPFSTPSPRRTEDFAHLLFGGPSQRVPALDRGSQGVVRSPSGTLHTRIAADKHFLTPADGVCSVVVHSHVARHRGSGCSRHLAQRVLQVCRWPHVLTVGRVGLLLSRKASRGFSCLIRLPSPGFPFLVLALPARTSMNLAQARTYGTGTLLPLFTLPGGTGRPACLPSPLARRRPLRLPPASTVSRYSWSP